MKVSVFSFGIKLLVSGKEDFLKTCHFLLTARPHTSLCRRRPNQMGMARRCLVNCGISTFFLNS